MGSNPRREEIEYAPRDDGTKVPVAGEYVPIVDRTSVPEGLRNGDIHIAGDCICIMGRDCMDIMGDCIDIGDCIGIIWRDWMGIDGRIQR